MPRLTDGASAAIRRGAKGVRRRLLPYSDYDQTIPPEIFGDEFYETIRSLARTARVKTILEIGSSTGEGSTRAFVEGMRDNPDHPVLLCMEVSRARFQELARRYKEHPDVKCYNLTSVPVDRFPTEAEVTEFYRTRQTKLNRVPLGEVLRWLRQDLRYLARTGGDGNGIRTIKRENGIERFGMVLIDGSEFTGPAEFDEVYGADYILLDDIGMFKNLRNFERMRADPAYRLVAKNEEVRNGYAAFERLAR